MGIFPSPRDAARVRRSEGENGSIGVSRVNWLGSQHDSRRDGHGRSYGGRVAQQQVLTMRGMQPLFVVIASDCAAKPTGLEGAARGSPG